MANLFTPSLVGANGPWYIDREDCLGDSLQYINANTNYLAAYTAAVSSTASSQINTAVTTLSTYATGTALLSSNGYQILPGGLIMQWGIVDFNNSSYWSNGNARRTITFPRSFSIAPWSVTVTPVIPSGIPAPTFGGVAYDKIGQVSAITNLGADLIIQGTSGSGNNLLAIKVSYLAIGF